MALHQDESERQPACCEVSKIDEVFVRIHIRYRNSEGRQVALQHAAVVHYDFDELSPILSVTIHKSSLPLLRSDPNIEYADGDGAVMFLRGRRVHQSGEVLLTTPSC
mmetsp:Transcript_26453/g.37911  ORF Transcript_26453/g.37911 Transcript_26453/m.37911 type:complete len:107 (-) Transcript_26453:592-912(-)